MTEPIYQAIKNFIVDLIFPRECICCGQGKKYLCSKCQAQIQLNNRFYCALCKKESPASDICLPCQQNSPLKAIWVTADYNNQIVEDLIHNLKYKYIEELSGFLVNIISDYLQQNKIFGLKNINKENTVLVPVPLHKKRFLQRSFNQSQLLGQGLSRKFGLSIMELVVRSVNTPSQINLSRLARQENVKNAFRVNESLLVNLPNKQKIILVDDVVTTGSTLNECARVLYDQGFTEIYGLVVAQKDN